MSARFGVRLRQLRQQRRLTQLALAKLCGVNRTFVSDLERGRKAICLPALQLLAVGLRISLSELLRNV